MFAVVGTWKMDTSLSERQAQMLPMIVAGVRQNEGFVRGFWSNDVDEPETNVTFVVFDTRGQAEDFRKAVLGNAPAQAESGMDHTNLRIVEIAAEA